MIGVKCNAEHLGYQDGSKQNWIDRDPIFVDKNKSWTYSGKMGVNGRISTIHGKSSHNYGYIKSIFLTLDRIIDFDMQKFYQSKVWAQVSHCSLRAVI